RILKVRVKCYRVEVGAVILLFALLFCQGKFVRESSPRLRSSFQFGTTSGSSLVRGIIRYVGIPVKVNADSGRKPNGVPLEGEQQSERSDAGVLIVKEVFGIVK